MLCNWNCYGDRSISEAFASSVPTTIPKGMFVAVGVEMLKPPFLFLFRFHFLPYLPELPPFWVSLLSLAVFLESLSGKLLDLKASGLSDPA